MKWALKGTTFGMKKRINTKRISNASGAQHMLVTLLLALAFNFVQAQFATRPNNDPYHLTAGRASDWLRCSISGDIDNSSYQLRWTRVESSSGAPR